MLLKDFYRTRFSPFGYRNFNIFYAAQTWSLIGSWASDLARSWIVIEMMGKAASLGMVMMAGALPGLLLYLYGGALADRTHPQRTMVITKLLFAVLALTLAFALEMTKIQLWFLVLYAILDGTLISFDFPLHNKVLVRLIKKEHLQQALTLNSVNFHSARMLGPLVAGVFLATWGPSSVFFFDGLSFLFIAFLISRVKLLPPQELQEKNPKPSPSHGQLSPSHLLKDLKQYLKEDVQIRFFLLQLLTTVLIILPITVVILRTYLKKKFNLDAEGFGLLFASPAAGSLVGALMMTFTQPLKPYRNLLFSIPILIFSLISITQMDSKALTTVALFFIGCFSYLTFASLTLSVHLTVKESFRGRMGSLIAMGFTCIGPLVSFPVGAMADHFGSHSTIYALLSLYTVLSLITLSFYLKIKQTP